MQRPVHSRLVLEHIDPVARRRKRWLGVLLLVALCAATYFLGNLALRMQLEDARERVTALQSELLSRRAESARLVAENADLRRAAQVDKASVERVREDLNELTRNLANAQAELDVYRELAAANVDAEVAQPFSVSLQAGREPNTWRVQLALIRAYASEGGETVRLRLALIEGAGPATLLDERELTMEYFRVVGVSFQLDPDAQPKQLRLTVQQDGEPPQTLDLPWQALRERPWRSATE